MKNKTIFTKIFVSFLILIIVPMVIVTGSISFLVVRSSNKEVAKSGLDKLGVVTKNVEYMLKNVEVTALDISLSDYVTALGSIAPGHISDTDNVFIIHDLVGYLERQERVYSQIYSIYFYDETLDLVISSAQELTSAGRFVDRDWLSAYQPDGGLTWLPARDVPNYSPLVYEASERNISPIRAITLIYPSTSFPSGRRGAVIVNVRSEALADILTSNYQHAENGYTFILDSQGGLVANSMGAPENMDFGDITEHINGQQGDFAHKLGGKDHVFTYVRSSYNDWIYVNVLPLGNVVGRTGTVTVGLLLITALLVLCGIFVSYIVSKRLTRPVDKLMNKISKRNGETGKRKADEFTVISDVVNEMLKQENYITRVLGQDTETIENSYLLQFLKGELSDDVEDLFADMQDCTCYVVVSVHIDNYKRTQSAFTEEELYSIKRLIVRTGERIFRDYGGYIGVVDKKSAVECIVGMNDSDRARLRSNLLLLQTEAENLLDNTVTVVVGCVVAEPGELYRSYQTANEAACETVLYDCGQLVEYEEYQQHGENRDMQYPVQIEKHMMSYIDIGDRDKYASAVSAFIDELRRIRPMADVARLMVNQLLGVILSYLNSHGIRSGEAFPYNVYIELSQLETLDEIELFLCNVGIMIITYKKNQLGEDNHYIKDMLDFIQENYRRDIDINQIAEHVGISYSHARKIFSEKMGTNIVSYLNHLRLEEAKKKLVDTGDSIVNIALSLGYNNEQSFNRYFKKYYGITPGEYRRANRK